MVEERWNLCAKSELFYYLFNWYLFILYKVFLPINRIDVAMSDQLQDGVCQKKTEKKVRTILESGCWTEHMAGGSPKEIATTNFNKPHIS